MKRFATHRVYSLLTAEIKSSQVLELEEDGRVSKLYPFTEEISATEWLPGWSYFLLVRYGKIRKRIFLNSKCV